MARDQAYREAEKKIKAARRSGATELSPWFHNYDDVFFLGILYAALYIRAYNSSTFWSLYAQKKPLFSSPFCERAD
jgi:hypothetical protein